MTLDPGVNLGFVVENAAANPNPDRALAQVPPVPDGRLRHAELGRHFPSRLSESLDAD